MEPTRVRADFVILVGGLVGWGGIFLIDLLLGGTSDSTAIGVLLATLVVWAVVVGVLLARRRRSRSQLESHRWSHPMPGPIGLYRDSGPVDETSAAGVTTVGEAPPRCPRCGTRSRVGELSCSRCGSWLWNQTPPPPARGSET